MAGSDIAIKVTADSSQFAREMSKVASDVKSRAMEITTAFTSIQSKIAGIAGGAAIVALFHDTIKSAAALADFSEQTGSSVESLSRLANQAKIAGADFSTLQALTLKLATGMAGVDQENSKVGRGLDALGISTRDPADALQQIAVKLNTYADGIGKAAIARDLFGKGGPAFLSVLKDMANLQDVAATVTTKQAEEAKKLEQALARISVESVTLKNAILTNIIPPLNDAIEQFRIARLAGLGFWSSFQAAGIDADQNLGPAIASMKKHLAELNEQKAYAAKFKGQGFVADIQKDVDELDRKLRVVISIRDAAIMRNQGDNSDQISRRFQRKPELDYTGGKDPKAAKEGVDEFAKALEHVRELAASAGGDFRAAFSSEPITQAQRALDKLQASDAWGKLTAAQQASLQAGLHSIDALEKQTVALKKYNEETKAAIKAEEAIAAAQEKAREHITQKIGDYAQSNDVLVREIALIGADDVAHQKLTAALEYERLQKEAIAAGDIKGLDILDEQYAKRLKLIDVFAKTSEDLKKVNEVRDSFAHNFDDAFVGIVTGTKSVRSAFADMAKSIEADISRIAARNIRQTLFGEGTTGGDWLTKFAGLFTGAGGGAIHGGAIGDAYIKLVGAAEGTDFARGGLTLVGERGPELVNLPRGAQVTPNHRLGGQTINVTQNITVMPGASTKTASQIGTDAAWSAQRALSRNG